MTNPTPQLISIHRYKSVWNIAVPMLSLIRLQVLEALFPPESKKVPFEA
jgi:hypothetical protein